MHGFASFNKDELDLACMRDRLTSIPMRTSGTQRRGKQAEGSTGRIDRQVLDLVEESFLKVCQQKQPVAALPRTCRPPCETSTRAREGGEQGRRGAQAV
jgi:hypothetical protein